MKSRPLIISLVAGVAAVVLLYLYLQKVEREASGGRKVAVLVAASMIPRDTPITDAMLGVRNVPISYLDERVVRASEKSRLLGLKSANAIAVQQSVIWNDVMLVKDDQRALSTLVQPGNRATPIRVQLTDVLSLVHPGDFVDIVCICGESREATVLLQKVLVLATGNDTSSGSTQAKDAFQRATVLTVSTSLQESQLLMLAMERGKLSAVVRNSNDSRIAEAPADVTSVVLTDASRRQVAQTPKRKVAAGGPVELKENHR